MLRKAIISAVGMLSAGFLLLGGTAPHVAFAICDASAASLDLSECYKLNSTQTVKSVYGTPSDLANVLVKNLMIFGGIFAFIMIVAAGFKIITSDSAKAKDEGLGMLKNVIIGIILMLSAYWIVQIIRVITGTQVQI